MNYFPALLYLLTSDYCGLAGNLGGQESADTVRHLLAESAMFMLCILGYDGIKHADNLLLLSSYVRIVGPFMSIVMFCFLRPVF